MSLVISILAIVIAGLSLLVSWRTYARDRARLRATLELTPSPVGLSFAITVVNAGRRIAYVRSYSVYFLRGNPLSDSIAGGDPLKEGQSQTFWLPVLNEKGEPLCDPRLVRRLEVIDTLGNRYSYPSFSIPQRRGFRRLKGQIAREWAELLLQSRM